MRNNVKENVCYGEIINDSVNEQTTPSSQSDIEKIKSLFNGHSISNNDSTQAEQQNSYYLPECLLGAPGIEIDANHYNDHFYHAKDVFGVSSVSEENLNSTFEMFDFLVERDKVEGIKTQKSRAAQMLIQATKNNNADDLSDINEGTKLSRRQMAKIFADCNIFNIIDSVLHVYERASGLHVALNRDKANIIVRRQSPEEIKDKITSNTVSEIVLWLRSQENWKRMDGAELKSLSADYINFKNCTLKISSIKPLKHSPDFYCTNSLNIDYHEWSGDFNSCLFSKILHDMFGDNQERIDLLQEIFAITIANKNLKHFYYFYGVPDSGKTILTDLLKYIMGAEYTSALAWDRFDGEFKLSGLYRKRLNIAAESSKVTISGMEITKRLTGGDYISSGVKYEKDVEFYCLATLIFMSNHKLEVINGVPDKAFLNRMVVLEFSNSIPPEKQDGELFEKLKAPNEINAILAWALEGVKRLEQNNNKLTITANPEDFILHKSQIGVLHKKEDFVDSFKSYIIEEFDINSNNLKEFTVVPDIIRGFKDYIGVQDDISYEHTLILHDILQDEMNLVKRRRTPYGKSRALKAQEYAYLGLTPKLGSVLWNEINDNESVNLEVR